MPSKLTKKPARKAPITGLKYMVAMSMRDDMRRQTRATRNLIKAVDKLAHQQVLVRLSLESFIAKVSEMWPVQR
jgi:ribosomal protein S7